MYVHILHIWFCLRYKGIYHVKLSFIASPVVVDSNLRALGTMALKPISAGYYLPFGRSSQLDARRDSSISAIKCTFLDFMSVASKCLNV